MEYAVYQDAQDFLTKTQSVFEENEALYGLMYGISLRLVKNLFHYGDQPFLATVADRNTLELIALMTPPYKLQIASFSSTPAAYIELLANELRKGQWPVPAVLAKAETAEHFESVWNRLTGSQSEHGMCQRIYALRAVEHLGNAGGTCRPATMEDLEYAGRWSCSFHDDCFGTSDPEKCTQEIRSMIKQGDLYIWEDPLPVSMAGFCRPTKNGVSISYVYTPPEFRRKGYASALVAALSGSALEKGKKFCTLYTDLGNPTSNRIYQKIGYNPVADVMDVNFANPDSLT